MPDYPEDAISHLTKRVAKLERENAEHKAKINEYKYQTDIQVALNQIMQVSLLPLPLSDIQSRILEIMLNIEWLTLEKKGCMFIVESQGELTMTAHKNLSDSLLLMCNKVPFGNCLCGRAALEKKLIFKNCLDADHSYRPQGIQPHGHYNAPIKDRNNTVLGVLNLYVKEGHKPSRQEKTFIESVCNVLAILFESKKLEEKLRLQAETDHLTGLMNRRKLMEYLDRYISRAKRKGTKNAVLFLDLNKFKIINDNLGHEVGDYVLQETAKRLKNAIRAHDLVARLGGDEFIIVLDDIDNEQVVIKKIRDVIHQPFNFQDMSIQVGVSIGYALYPDESQFSDELIKIADKKMYDDKK